jgi:hypothetical protein
MRSGHSIIRGAVNVKVERRMKKASFVLAIILLAGCSTSFRVKTPAKTSSEPVAVASPRYEHQIDVEYADGGTKFLRLVEVQDP